MYHHGINVQNIEKKWFLVSSCGALYVCLHCKGIGLEEGCVAEAVPHQFWLSAVHYDKTISTTPQVGKKAPIDHNIIMLISRTVCMLVRPSRGEGEGRGDEG